jgi:hypothetical protein
LKKVDFNGLNSSLLLTVDKRKGKIGMNEFNRYLEIQLEAILPLNQPYDISHMDSKQSMGLQSVDLFCWGIWKSYEHQDNTWKNYFVDKCEIVLIENLDGIKKDGP